MDRLPGLAREFILFGLNLLLPVFPSRGFEAPTSLLAHS